MSRDSSPESTSVDGATMPASRLLFQLILGGVTYAVLLALVVSPRVPWESDQPFKAAQIQEIAYRHDYFLSPAVPDCYRLRTLSFYYSVSALFYNLCGGDIFTFMNYSSVPLGVIAGIGLAWALYNTFRIRPLWSFFTLAAMPLFVVTTTYGNEAVWSIAFFCLSLALVSSRQAVLHIAGGVAVAISLFCRSDVLFLAPFWLAWVYLFAYTTKQESWLVRTLRPAGAFIVAAAILFLLFLRRVPTIDTTSEYVFNLKLIVAFLSYPFNLSVVALAAIGWLLLCKRHTAYACCHLLLLLPLAFYFRIFSSPKYMICLIVFFGLPSAYLLEQANRPLRIAMSAAILAWFVVGFSPYGVFGPRTASLWYIPSADGPTPIGGYLDFYARSHAGEYQAKQVENIDQFRDFAEFAKTAPDSYWIAGYWPVSAFRHARALGELGTPEHKARIEKICDAPGSLGKAQPDDGSHMLMFRTGYTSLDSVRKEVADQVRSWLEKGQVRAVGAGANEPLPTLIEIGDHIPADTGSELGKRILFANEYYQNRRLFSQREFIKPYHATSWAPASAKVEAQPLYRDSAVAVYDTPVAGAVIYSYAWPARYQ